MSLDCAVVLGTYNRLALLKTAISSIRRSVGVLSYTAIVVDGGSTDGSVEWLSEQDDVTLIAGDLSGAVKNFNLGFARAVDYDAAYVCILNDDDELIGPSAEIQSAVALMERDPTIGAVAFETDLRGPWACEEWNGRAYCNKGVVRRIAGMAAARAQGDPSGKAWWSRDHRTYASDTELGLWIWRLGWEVVRGLGLRVHDNADANCVQMDALRAKNVKDYLNPETGTAKLFHARWNKPADAEYHRDDAVRFGGRVAA